MTLAGIPSQKGRCFPAALLLLSAGCALSQAWPEPATNVGVYFAGPAFSNEQAVLIFPPGPGRRGRIQLPFAFGVMAFSRSGRSLYGTRQNSIELGQQPVPGIFRFDLESEKTAALAGSEGFAGVHSLAVFASGSGVLISGRYFDRQRFTCGLFSLNREGVMRTILQTHTCGSDEKFLSLSLSPDDTHAVAIQGNEIKLIDLLVPSVRTVANDYIAVSWSPDGRFVAATRRDVENSTVILAAGGFDKAARIRSTELVWSPDSRYLLAFVSDFTCGPYRFTIGAVDLKNGRVHQMESSRCSVTGGIPAWIAGPGHPAQDP